MTLPSTSLARRIADAALHLSCADLPPHSQDRLRWSALDFLGCAIGGAAARELAPALLLAAPGPHPVPGLDQTFDMPGVALVLGTAGALFQLHDVYLPGHIHTSSPVLPAAWALWQRQGGSATALLDALLAGYETVNRLSAITYPHQQKAGSTPTATLGALGAAVAAGRLAGLDGAGLAAALANAAMLAPLTPFQALRDHGPAVPLHGGAAARVGVEAVLLAEAGWSAGSQVLEGADGIPGWLQVLQGDPARLAPEAWDGRSVDDLVWKLLPACYASLPAVEAALRLPRVRAADIRHVELLMAAGPMVLVAQGPLHDGLALYDRLMSVRRSVAQVLAHGRYGVDLLHPSAGPDEAVEALLPRIVVRHEPALDAALPAAVAATLRLHLHDGTLHEVAHRRDPRRPLADGHPCAWIHEPDPALLMAKYRALTSHQAQAAQALSDWLQPGCALSEPAR